MCPTLHNPMDCSTAGFPVLYCLLEFAQIHVHWISDAIQPSHPLLSTSPPDINLSLFSPNRAACSLHYVYIVQGSARHLGIVSVQFSHSVVSNSLRPHEPQHARPPCPSPTPRVNPNSCPLSWWSHPTISSSVTPSPPALNLSQHQGLFKWVNSSHQVAKILEFQLQHQSFQWTPRTDL